MNNADDHHPLSCQLMLVFITDKLSLQDETPSRHHDDRRHGVAMHPPLRDNARSACLPSPWSPRLAAVAAGIPPHVAAAAQTTSWAPEAFGGLEVASTVTDRPLVTPQYLPAVRIARRHSFTHIHIPPCESADRDMRRAQQRHTAAETWSGLVPFIPASSFFFGPLLPPPCFNYPKGKTSDARKWPYQRCGPPLKTGKTAGSARPNSWFRLETARPIGVRELGLAGRARGCLSVQRNGSRFFLIAKRSAANLAIPAHRGENAPYSSQ